MTDTDLVKRLEKATGPDRELDLCVYKLLGGLPPTDGRLYWTAPSGLSQHYESLIPKYTASLDAALTLATSSVVLQRMLRTAEASIEVHRESLDLWPSIRAALLVALKDREAKS